MPAPRIPRQGPGLQGPRTTGQLPYPHPTRKNGATGRLGAAPGRYWADGWRWWLVVGCVYAGLLTLAYWAGGT